MIIALDGPVMPYAWGSRSALADLLGRSPSGKPEAELWLGAHVAGPARLGSPVGEALDLRALLATDPAGLLGAELALRYGRLPFLLKILAIERPLSLQTHPNAEQAREGFAREEAFGLPRGHATRSYQDDQHKPELLLALSPVEALCSFRPPAEALALLSAFGLSEAASPLAAAVATFAQGGDAAGYEALMRSFFELPEAELGSALGILLGSALRGPRPGGPLDFAWIASWLIQLSAAYGTDPGLLAVLLLRPVHLEPGEAIFLPARRLHAYLSGVGVEVMAASDNVLRGGLTPKHVDVAELCRVLDFSPTPPHLVSPIVDRPGVRVFRTPAEEFELWSIELEGGEPPILVPSPCVVLVLDGHIEVTQAAERAEFERGGQAFVSWSLEQASIGGRGRVVVAAVRKRAA